MWQAEADMELTLSALPATTVGQWALTLAHWRYITVPYICLSQYILKSVTLSVTTYFTGLDFVLLLIRLSYLIGVCPR